MLCDIAQFFSILRKWYDFVDAWDCGESSFSCVVDEGLRGWDDFDESFFDEISDGSLGGSDVDVAILRDFPMAGEACSFGSGAEEHGGGDDFGCVGQI